ncbi:MAG: hypothetical protein ACJA0X_000712 [Cyclobacteriaceae bacterium]|jgi:hypothetical protein
MRYLKIGLFATVAIAVLLFGFMWLWNWLMPSIFGASVIDIYQAAGLLLLSRILFGSWGGKHQSNPKSSKKNWVTNMKTRWQNMTPDEKEKFKDRWGWCSDMEDKDQEH